MRLEPWVRCAKKIGHKSKSHESAVSVVSSLSKVMIRCHSSGDHYVF